MNCYPSRRSLRKRRPDMVCCSSMKLPDHFGLIAPFYDRIFAEHNSARLRELLALPAGRLLDVGGGTGRVSATLVGGARLVVLADPSQAMLGASRVKPGLGPARAHAERLPFPDGSFDRVLVVDAFHHFSDHRQAAGELLRVVAPGGRLVVEELNYERLPVKLIALGEKVLLMGSHFYGPGRLRRLFEAKGVRVTVHVDDQASMWVVAEKPGA
jgi:demethylmenaquinone methyltransferase/2-methoxy-6-polyprenyl-1,4-benzoquinol methylase